MKTDSLKRRPIKARETKWAAAIAQWLVRIGLRPNAISLLSVVCAALAAGNLVLTVRAGVEWRIVLFLLAAVLIQLRLLCNLFDGMVAVEGGFKTKTGEIFNELPDRFADVLILLGTGYSLPTISWANQAGWAAAVLAVLTAYVRALGGVAGASQYFTGPMAKPHRMAVVTFACVLDGVGAGLRWPVSFLAISLGVIVAGCLITIVRRTRRILVELNSK